MKLTVIILMLFMTYPQANLEKTALKTENNNCINSDNFNINLMEQRLKELILSEIKGSENSKFLEKTCNQYLDYYFSQSSDTQLKLSQLLKKYNSETILSFLGENGYPKGDYTHMSLGHNIGDKNLFPMLDNGGGIYPVDKEIGQICTDPEFWDENESDKENELRWKYHGIIFYCWLGIAWMEVEGYKSGIVVKTTENNSVTPFYLNDFEFDDHSQFENVVNWKEATKKYNKTTISIEDLLLNVKKNFK